MIKNFSHAHISLHRKRREQRDLGPSYIRAGFYPAWVISDRVLSDLGYIRSGFIRPGLYPIGFYPTWLSLSLPKILLLGIILCTFDTLFVFALGGVL
jgi:hypothetical protein